MLSDIQPIVNFILTEPERLGDIREAVHVLHEKFFAVTGVNAHAQTYDDIPLPSGVAIGSAKAAHCLLEFQRTAVFLRGIHQALNDLIAKNPGKRLTVLYAGCGPYATLITPLLPFFTPAQLGIQLLDVNQNSLNAVQKLYELPELSPYLIGIVKEDATTYRLPEGLQPDLVLCEALLNALRKEPQVAITRNIVPQLEPDAIFIPQEITVSAVINSWEKEMESFSIAGHVPERIQLGTLFTISQQELDYPQPQVLNIPAEVPAGFSEVYYFTRIRVYGDEILDAYSCSLTQPMKIGPMAYFGGKEVSFTYTMGDRPRFRYEVIPAQA